MAVYEHGEQEQLDQLKAWWQRHGNAVTGVLLAVSLALAGWQGWNWYQRQQATQASAIFGVLQRAAADKDAQRVKAATGELLEKFGGSSYAPMAALIAGKVAFESGDAKTARVQFSWAVDHATGELKDLARLRLAAVLLDEKAFEDALKLLVQPENRNFEALFADSRGDVLLAQGKRVEAIAAFRSALEKADALRVQKNQEVAAGGKNERPSPFRELVQQKLDALGDV